MSVSGTGTPICGTCGRESYNSECEVCRLRRDANAHLERAWKAEARVKEKIQELLETRTEAARWQARCERMRGIIDSHTCPTKNHPDVSCHICNQLAALDADTTAGEQG